jgi:hypothetical protein
LAHQERTEKRKKKRTTVNFGCETNEKWFSADIYIGQSIWGGKSGKNIIVVRRTKEGKKKKTLCNQHSSKWE